MELVPPGELNFEAGENSNEVRIKSEGVGVGMFVSRLDRPWYETTFPSSGFRVNNDQQVELLKDTCRFLYVDTRRGESPDHVFWILDKDQLSLSSGKGVDKAAVHDEFKKLRVHTYRTETELEIELRTARLLQSHINAKVHRIQEEFQNGASLDVEGLQECIDDIVSSVLRNPSALNLLSQINTKSGYSYKHAIRSSIWCAQFGRHLGMGKEEIHQLALGGLLLDFGMLRVDKSILEKQTALTRDDVRTLRSHVDHSIHAVARRGLSPKILRMIATHHERADGSGYMEGLKNGDIPLYGRIAGIVDSYDAMTSKRPYNQNPMTPYDAIMELYSTKGGLFQAELVELFIQAVGIYPIGSLVELNNGQVGVVVAVHERKRLAPALILLTGADKKPLQTHQNMNLAEGEGKGLHIANGLPHGAYGLSLEDLF